jgi:hypothetical protein
MSHNPPSSPNSYPATPPLRHVLHRTFHLPPPDFIWQNGRLLIIYRKKCLSTVEIDPREAREGKLRGKPTFSDVQQKKNPLGGDAQRGEGDDKVRRKAPERGGGAKFQHFQMCNKIILLEWESPLLNKVRKTRLSAPSREGNAKNQHFQMCNKRNL